MGPTAARQAHDLPADLAVLSRRYASLGDPPARGPFELVLWENVAYLASPARRAEAFALLARTVGTTPEAIAAAPVKALRAVALKGILPAQTVAKLRRCARIALDDCGGDLQAVVDGPVDVARRILRRFPAIGAPGADKILLFCGRIDSLAPESNGLRVLTRLGYVSDGLSYAQAYAASGTLRASARPSPARSQRAHLLLQEHGRTTCTRRAPRCEACPLARRCPSRVTAT